MKKLVIIFFVILIGVFAYYTYDKKDLENTKAQVLNDILVFEYGEDVIIEHESYSLTYDVQNPLKPEKHEVMVSFPYKRHTIEKPVMVEIKDTTPPEFTKFKDHYELYENETIKDIEKNYEAKDLSEVSIKIDLDAVDFKKEGQYTAQVTASDTSNNITKKEFTVHVKKKPTPKPKPKPTPKPSAPNVKDAFYVDGHVIVNKKHPLPPNFAYGEDPTAAKKVRELIAEMKRQGLKVDGSYAGFRTYEHQERLYTNYVKNYGQKAADISSAKPGYSEHQTGLTFDLRSPTGVLLQTEPEITWVKENAHRFGFIVRYPEGKTHITGYKHEPWHLRYLGSDATKIYESNLTLEEYYNFEG